MHGLFCLSPASIPVTILAIVDYWAGIPQFVYNRQEIKIIPYPRRKSNLTRLLSGLSWSVHVVNDNFDSAGEEYRLQLLEPTHMADNKNDRTCNFKSQQFYVLMHNNFDSLV